MVGFHVSKLQFPFQKSTNGLGNDATDSFQK
jgi:hypothetical protein